MPDINTQSITPWNNGTTPTDFSLRKDKPDPIKNKVKVNPILAMSVKYGTIGFIKGT